MARRQDLIMKALHDRITSLEAERDALQTYAHEATKMITRLTGGGSEFFGKQIGTVITADLHYCEEFLRARNTRHLEKIKELMIAAKSVTDAMVKDAATEFLSHKGERPWRVTKRGAELWEDYIPAMRAALECALEHAATAAEPVDEIEPYEFMAREFERLSILRKMWTAHEVAAIIRRYAIPAALEHAAPAADTGRDDLQRELEL